MGNCVWLNVAPAQVAVVWQLAQAVLNPAAAWLGFVVA
jgi:hypothetical protein